MLMDCDLFQDKQIVNELEAYLLGFFMQMDVFAVLKKDGIKYFR